MLVSAIQGAILAAFSLPATAAVSMHYVTVGNAGNPANTTGYGAVAYEYQIGKYEVTNAQYADFLNAKAATDTYALYNLNMAYFGITRSGSSGLHTYSVTSGFGNRPVVFVSWYDAARFSNWLANGQGSGDTETGSYTLKGATTGVFEVNVGATVYIPNEHEWYKAAYYIGAASTYSLYPNGRDSITTADANFGNNVGSSSDVGTYSSAPSFYGTFDQGGNVSEWNDAILSGSSRGVRGGAWAAHELYLRSSAIAGVDPSLEGSNLGFRVASIPEPGAMVLTMLASGVILIRRKR
jgi:sulfatase modifying factor 1